MDGDEPKFFLIKRHGHWVARDAFGGETHARSLEELRRKVRLRAREQFGAERFALLIGSACAQPPPN